ncbi:hypothetical protein BG006_004812 [Podila minutissima]|uniref:Uncharacterized protein n=1 Tax=Podila minutissima TaxID=64525 RepID=A0A9P5VM49_9FUNG|nr:hypothetical protein BG006_004812 [Podila minutissima]
MANDVKESLPAEDTPFNFGCSVHSIRKYNLTSILCPDIYFDVMVAFVATASINVYIDIQKELDFVQFRLTHSVRNLYLSLPSCTIKVHLASQQRLDITVASTELCQSIYDIILRVKLKSDDTDGFLKHQPKTDLVKPDPMAAFLTAKNDVFVDTTPSMSSIIPSRKRLLSDPILSREHDVKIPSKRLLLSPKTASKPKQT